MGNMGAFQELTMVAVATSDWNLHYAWDIWMESISTEEEYIKDVVLFLHWRYPETPWHMNEWMLLLVPEWATS